MGALDAGSVYDHESAEIHPWLWAGVHAPFISALGVVNIVVWRMSEDARDAMRESDVRFRSAFEDALAATGLEPRLLCLEVTESAVMADPEAATALLERLKALGVRLAIDDFGVGYSSLSQLKALLAVDTIKIDKSFVDGVPGGEDQAIVDAILRLADGLGLAAIAEGVETGDQVDALLGMGCRLSQGFHFARPQSPADLERLLALDALGELAA
jgi:EAL domain-containing protein (putative c-di-GMP-specific phosphodiesterase class I)